jgi:hypothetical protein
MDDGTAYSARAVNSMHKMIMKSTIGQLLAFELHLASNIGIDSINYGG